MPGVRKEEEAVKSTPEIDLAGCRERAALHEERQPPLIGAEQFAPAINWNDAGVTGIPIWDQSRDSHEVAPDLGVSPDASLQDRHVADAGFREAMPRPCGKTVVLAQDAA